MKRSAESTHYTTSNGCPTGKRAYQSRKAAREANSRFVRMGRDRLSPYQCKQCIGWHLGHLPHDVRRGNIARSEINDGNNHGVSKRRKPAERSEQ